ncbi:hypothetical protein Tsubulata_021529 [Turnera subulata]|uniref:VLRF1 domain-containing protein n=1 Tax=Turnera subulata TaxID=218843 RepID=A0A9Q0JKY6_9ROSI|nr:hypothetical protein Tsubulata_021529 [Turnera subulata]
MAIGSFAAEATHAAAGSTPNAHDKRNRSIFDVPSDLFDGCRLLSPSAAALASEAPEQLENPIVAETLDEIDDEQARISKNGVDNSVPRWTCHTCGAEFDSLQEQRAHFKSDIHRINVKLSVAGKPIVNEDDFDELTSDAIKDYDISSVSGSEDEAERGSLLRNDWQKGLVEGARKKIFFRLESGERVSIWKCLLLNEAESVSYPNEKEGFVDNSGFSGFLGESEVIERLESLIHEPRDGTRLRIVLLASGGHFAGCVFDGNSVVAHKTFHRYVVRAKAGKKQSSKDGTGRAAHSAGASLRRYNELALKKDIQDLLAAWKHYFDSSSCVFFHAPSSNRQLLFDGDKAYFNNQHCGVRSVPVSVRRPTLKEARRIYNQLTQVAYEAEKEIAPDTKDDLVLSTSNIADRSIEDVKEALDGEATAETSSSDHMSDKLIRLSVSEDKFIGTTTALHEAAKSGDADKVLELLEQGMDPCVKDERGRTPYMVANEKEVRNTFRRFMASNMDRWDWRAADVPSALTKELEESQAAKQAEKEAKRKARAKELKKLRKAREKKAQAEAAEAQKAAAGSSNQGTSSSATKGQTQAPGASRLSKEEELKRAQAAEREKRAAAAEKRMAAAANTQSSSTTTMPSAAPTKSGLTSEITCSCCNVSLAGKIPFHRYNYKYCSTSCMHVHREILEDG